MEIKWNAKPYKLSGNKLCAKSGQLDLFNAKVVSSNWGTGQMVTAGKGTSHIGVRVNEGLSIIGFSFIVLYAW